MSQGAKAKEKEVDDNLLIVLKYFRQVGFWTEEQLRSLKRPLLHEKLSLGAQEARKKSLRMDFCRLFF